MTEKEKGFHLLDYVEFFVTRKALFLRVFLLSLVLGYAGIYFLVEEQFEATATIIPREDETGGLASSVLRGMKGLPLGLGSKSPSNEVDLYKTIIYSRTMIEDVIRRFDLITVYRLDSSKRIDQEAAVKRLRKEIVTKETEESAFLISARAGTRERAAEMTNYIVQRMNDRIIELKVSRSKENREFLGKRVEEIAATLKAAEDSLRVFQERSGLLDAKTQLQGILTAHTSLETELIAKKFQEGILGRLYDKESPQVKEAQIQIQEYQKKLAQLRARSDPGSPLLALKKLPQTSVEFLRRYREVEINNLLMEYMVPLYEQAKVEEKKDYPILQVIDYAVPPAKRSYPQRTLLALLGAVSITLLVYLFLLARESARNTTDPRVRALLRDAKRWTWKKQKQH
jgi:uncharacterized protein involved in exopolysaccharide biosynthesis